MPEPEQPISLGLNARPAEPSISSEILPPTESLQFRKAERGPDPGNGPQCLSCGQPTGTSFFQVNGQVVCAACAAAIESGQKALPPGRLLKAFLYGLGAAIAGSILYATVAIVTGLELALISILIGYMVGQAIRRGASSGGRPLQIIAVILTYLSISSSYVPVAIYQINKHRPTQVATAGDSGTVNTAPQARQQPQSLVSMVVALAGLAVGAPFMSIQGASGLLSLVIIFFGLQRAWRLTARPALVVTGPYQASAPA